MGNKAPGGSSSRMKIGSPKFPDPVQKTEPSEVNGEATDDQENGDQSSLSAEITESTSTTHQELTSSTTLIKTMVRALYKFERVDENDLAFNKGDLMEIDGHLPDTVEWVVAVHLQTKKWGYIPSNYVIIQDTTPQTQEWWADCDKKEANKRLLHAGNVKGTFLIRQATDQTSFALSVRDLERSTGNPCVRHYRIFKMDDDQGYYISSRKIFRTLFDLINHYKEKADGLCCKLTSVCSSMAPVVPFKELEISRKNVSLSTKLGAGFFGEVWKGIYLKVIDVAVKTLKSGTMSSEAFLGEARIMHQLRHPKLVQILGVVSSEEPFYIITELMVNGALRDFLLSDKGKRLKFETLIDMTSQIAEGMAYLETVNFIHRDLRAANILVGHNNEVKVADFGMARILDEEVYDARADSKFPIKWTAPEAAFERQFSVKSDVWSFGVLLYEIITHGRSPYPGIPNPQVLQAIERGYRMDKPSNAIFTVPDSYYEMMLKCWQKKPEERPTFASLYDFFSDYFINVEPFYRELTD